MAKYFPTYQSTFDNYLFWRMGQQRLTRPSDANIANLIPACGWISASGPTVQLALFHREHGDALGNYRNALHDNDVVQVRTVRGINMLVEKALVPYAIAANQRVLANRWRSGWRAAGIDDAGKQKHKDAVLEALGSNVVTDDELAAKVPAVAETILPAAASKKAGNHRTLLALVLDELEEEGLVHHHQGTWARYETRFPSLASPRDIDTHEALFKLAERFFVWGNVATTEDLAWWLNVPVKQAESMMYGGELPLGHLMLSGSRTKGFMMHTKHAESLRSVKTEREGPVFMLPARDPFFSHMPMVLRRALDEPVAEKVFQSDVNLRPLVIEAGKPVAAWRWSEEGVQWSPVARMTPPLRRKINAVAERLQSWVQEKELDIKPKYGA